MAKEPRLRPFTIEVRTNCEYINEVTVQAVNEDEAIEKAMVESEQTPLDQWSEQAWAPYEGEVLD